MRVFRSEFSRMHALIMLSALINLLLGAGMALLGWPREPFGFFHGLTGALILPLWVVLPLFSPKRKNLYAAIRNRMFLQRRDWKRGNAATVLAKLITLLTALAYLTQLATGALIGTGLTYQLFPTFGMRAFHSRFVVILPVLLLLHAVLMAWAHRKPRVKATQPV